MPNSPCDSSSGPAVKYSVSGEPDRGPVAELQRPQPVDRERLAVRHAEPAAVRPRAVRALGVRVDLPVAEVPDEEVAGELAERPSGRHREPPRRVQQPARRDAAEQHAVGVVRVDEPQAGAVHVVLGVGVLLGVRDEERPADVLDAERREVRRDLRVGERARAGSTSPNEESNTSTRALWKSVAYSRAGLRVDREALVDRADVRAVGRRLGLRRGRGRRERRGSSRGSCRPRWRR